MMTYGKAREIIRDVCTPHTIYEIKKANKELKRLFGDNLLEIRKADDEFGNPIVFYEVFCEDNPYTIAFDFWNGIIAD